MCCFFLNGLITLIFEPVKKLWNTFLYATKRSFCLCIIKKDLKFLKENWIFLLVKFLFLIIFSNILLLWYFLILNQGKGAFKILSNLHTNEDCIILINELYFKRKIISHLTKSLLKNSCPVKDKLGNFIGGQWLVVLILLKSTKESTNLKKKSFSVNLKLNSPNKQTIINWMQENFILKKVVIKYTCSLFSIVCFSHLLTIAKFALWFPAVFS